MEMSGRICGHPDRYIFAHCYFFFYISQIILLSLNIVIILYFFAWRCNFGDKHLRQKTEMT